MRVLPDHITINSFPGPDASITLEALASGTAVARRYRNSRIGDFLKDLRLTEGRGTGIPTVIKAMKENGSPAPRFNTDAERAYFTAILPIHSGALSKNTPQVNTPQVREGQDAVRRYSRARERERIMLVFCESPRDRASIQARLGLKDPRNFRENYLYPMLQRGLVAMTDPEHPNSPQQKYRTTETGISLLETDE